MAKSDFRSVIRSNQNKTILVVIIFLLMYAVVGMLVDVVINADIYSKVDFQGAVELLLTGQVVPWGLITMVGIAVVCVLLSLAWHDRLMLMGNHYKRLDGSPEKLSLKEQQIVNSVEEMRIAANLGFLPKVYLIDADYMNAFASGYSEKSAMIAITRGLADKLNRDELQAVIAHEMNHIKHLDIKLTLFISVLSSLIVVALELLMNASYAVAHSVTSKNNNNSSNNAGAFVFAFYLVVLVLRLIFPLITGILSLFLSRSREYMADAGASKLTRNPEALASALIKIHECYAQKDYSKEDVGNDMRRKAYIVEPKAFFGDFFSTHPSLNKRLKALGVTVDRTE